MALVRFPRPSRRLSPRQSRRSRRYTRRQLGDKLQVLAAKSPTHLRVVEVFVDLILKRLELVAVIMLML